ncbi:MAG: hypothetical protein K940chlam9_00089 [Chlamydiae bacterium]|nr:hypothetical protein [Chlamydiota bacterium]
MSSGIPPSKQTSSSPTAPSKGDKKEPESANGGQQKEFRLSQRKKDEQEVDEKKKKQNLFDLSAEDQKQLEVGTQAKQGAEVKEAGKLEGIAAQTQVQQVVKLIQKMVTTMQIGQVGGRDMASLTLEKGGDVPEAFSGSNLSLQFTENGLTIHFDNFMTPQQEQNAMLLIEKNKEQLTDMVRALQAKNIQIAELSIGKYTVNLPKVEPLPPPFQTIQPSGAETRQQREKEEGGGEEKGGGGDKP